MISIIIPAFNEQTVIGRCLSALKGESAEFDIIVVCNGCTDRTAEVAAQVMPNANVISIDKASKSAALNIGLNSCKFESVILLDADIIFSAKDLLRFVSLAKEANCLIASPAVTVDLSYSNTLVKSYYRVTELLPYYQQQKISAVIFLSKEGKDRLGEIPELIADDRYIQLQFTEDEQFIINELSYTITPPKNISGLVKILTRSHLGNIELKQKYPKLANENKTGHSKEIARMLFRPKLSASVIVFITLKLFVRFRAKRQFNHIRQYQWEKDDSSRTLD